MHLSFANNRACRTVAVLSEQHIICDRDMTCVSDMGLYPRGTQRFGRRTLSSRRRVSRAPCAAHGWTWALIGPQDAALPSPPLAIVMPCVLIGPASLERTASCCLLPLCYVGHAVKFQQRRRREESTAPAARSRKDVPASRTCRTAGLA